MTNFLAFSSVEQPQRGLNGFLPLPFTAYTVSSLADETRATDALVVDGDLPSPKVFSLPDLKAMTREKVKRPIRSVDGWHSTHTWGGVWLATLMQTLRGHVAGLEPKYVLQTNRWGHQEVLRLSPELEANALLCDSIDGQPISEQWGGPIWLVVFDRYHYKGLEALSRLTLLNQAPPVMQRSEQLGLDPLGMLQPGHSVDVATGQVTSYSGV